MLGTEEVPSPFPEKPYVLYTLIALNVAVYLVTSAPTGFIQSTMDWIARLGYIPALLLTSPLSGFARIFTAMFTHADLLHIFFNMYFLYIFGRPLERSLGHWRFLALYLLSGVFAALFHTVFIYIQSPVQLAVPSVGASGAISGVLGAYMLLYPGTRLVACFFLLFFPFCFEMLAGYYILFWFAIQVLEGYFAFNSTVAFFAHAGGFLAGIALLPLVADEARIRLLRRLSRAQRLFGIITLLYPLYERRGLTPGTKAAFATLAALLLAGASVAYIHAATQPPIYMAAYRVDWRLDRVFAGSDIGLAAFTGRGAQTVLSSAPTIPARIVMDTLAGYNLLYSPANAGRSISINTLLLPPLTLRIPVTIYAAETVVVKPLSLKAAYDTHGFMAAADVEEAVQGRALHTLEASVKRVGLSDPLPLLRMLSLLSMVVVAGSLYVTLYRDADYVITPE